MMVELDRLGDEVRLTFHALTAFVRSAAEESVDPSGRAVLEHLDRGGSMTVPDIARARGVSRQHIQTIVNVLVADGLAETGENPAHRRSPLIAPTTKGLAALAEVVEREHAMLRRAFADFDVEACCAAVGTLAEVRRRLALLAEEVPA